MNLLHNVGPRLSRIFFRGFETTLLYTHDLSSVQNVVLAAGCEIRTLRREETALLEEISPVGESLALERLNVGECYIGFVERKPAHFSWVQTVGKHDLEDAGRSINIERGDLWIYHCETAPWARGNRLYPCALSRILENYRDRGYRRAWIYTTEPNRNSQSGIDRAGFILQRRMRAFHIAGVAIPLSDSR
jgi:hypothetical protein